jgi:peroxiredoxin
MNVRRKWLSTFGLALAVFGLTSVGLADEDKAETKKAEIGKASPAFTLKDMKGDEHKLADFAGKIVVLEWFNAGCPFVKNVYRNGVVESTLKQLEEIDESIVYFAVNSTNPERVGMSEKDINKQSKALLKESDVEVPILLDWDGAIGKAYGARTTPHMFVIDGKGVLRYQGAYTNDNSGKEETYINYVVDAVKQIKAGETVATTYVQPWGCSVKYAK